METQQWYKVNRRDGRIDYATKRDGNFYLNGYGFAITEFDAVSVEPIEGFPPSNNKQMYVGFDYTDIPYKAIVDTNNLWNGWLKPYIQKDDAIRMLNEIGGGDDWFNWSVDGDVITITDVDYNESDILELHEIDGDSYYYFGDLGWCFEKINGNYNDN